MIDARLTKVKELQASDLSQGDTARFISNLADEYVYSYMIGEARQLRMILTDLMRSAGLPEGTELYRQYEIALLKLSWMAVPLLTEKETEELFRKHLSIVLKLEDFNVAEKAAGFMQFMFGDNVAVQQRRNALLLALKDNEELIGSQKIVSDDGVEYNPMIKHWLKFYDQSSRIEKRLERLPLLEFMSANKNVSRLSDEEQLLLRQVLVLYDTIRFLVKDPTVSGTGHQLPGERIPAPQDFFGDNEAASDVLTVENTAEVTSAIKTEPTKNEVLEAYQGDKKTVQAITKEQQKLEAKFGTDTPRLRAEFFAAVQKKNSVRTIALVRVLAQQGDLTAFMQSDEKLHPFLRAIWEKRYGTEFAQQFDQAADAPEFLKLFLRYILEERLEMPENEAARVGLQIGNIFVSNGKKSYNKMVYFDVASKTFHWFE